MEQTSFLKADGALDQARVARDIGAQQALDHAEEDAPGWSDVAFLFLASFCRNNEHFISEDVSDASKTWGMVQPPTDRAWGMVYRRAIKEELIVQDGTGRSRRRHASLCPRWRSLIFGRTT